MDYAVERNVVELSVLPTAVQSCVDVGWSAYEDFAIKSVKVCQNLS